MISSLRGTVLEIGQSFLVIEISGIGMRAEVTSGCAATARLGEQASLHTQLVVREDSLTLFGFENREELEMFSLLTSVSGVGPRSGLGILSALTPARIVEAVRAEDEKPFKQVSGIGPKTAKLIAVTLQGKVDGFGYLEADTASPRFTAQSTVNDVVQALIGLGWSESAARDAVASAQHAGAGDDEKALLRASLVLLQNTPGRR